MKLKNAVTITVFAFTLFLLVLIWPLNSIELFNKRVNWEGLNLASVTNDKVRIDPKFKEGLDFRGGKKHTFEADLAGVEEGKREAYSKTITQKFASRLETYGYKDFRLKWQVEDTKLKVTLFISELTEFDSQVIPLLASKGEIIFWSQDPDYKADETKEDSFNLFQGMKQVDLNASDIDSMVSLISDKTGTVETKDDESILKSAHGLKVRFKEESATKMLLVASSETTRGTMMVIDGAPVAYRYLSNPNTVDTTNNLMYLNSFYSDNFFINDAIVNIFESGELDQELTLQSLETVGPMLGENYERNVKLALVVALALLSTLLIYRYNWLGLYQTIVNFVFIIWTLSLLKVTGTQLTLPLVLGATLSVLLMMLLQVDLVTRLKRHELKHIKKFEEEIKSIVPKYRNLLIVVLGMTVLLTKVVSLVEINHLALGLGVGVVINLLTTYISIFFILPRFYILQSSYASYKKS